LYLFYHTVGPTQSKFIYISFRLMLNQNWLTICRNWMESSPRQEPTKEGWMQSCGTVNMKNQTQILSSAISS
jgi:hypothetical protein